MKTILIYGDSNTWGQTGWPFVDTPRLESKERWTTQLQGLLGSGYEVIAEGLGGRTAGDVQVGDDKYRNGARHFKAIFKSHEPVSTLLFALGTNDCQTRYGRSAEDIYSDLRNLKERAEECSLNEYPSPIVVFVVPPKFTVEADNIYFGGREAVRYQLADLMINAPGLLCIDPGDIDCAADGVHFSTTGHTQMAKVVASKIREISI